MILNGLNDHKDDKKGGNVMIELSKGLYEGSLERLTRATRLTENCRSAADVSAIAELQKTASLDLTVVVSVLAGAAEVKDVKTLWQVIDELEKTEQRQCAMSEAEVREESQPCQKASRSKK